MLRDGRAIKMITQGETTREKGRLTEKLILTQLPHFTRGVVGAEAIDAIGEKIRIVLGTATSKHFPAVLN
jgi:hypothetical protein